MKIKTQVQSIAAFLTVASFPAWADSTGDIGDLPDILLQNLGIIADVMQTLAVLIGLALFVAGLFQLKRYGEMRTMMSAQMTIYGPLMTIIAGVAMLCLPLIIGTMLVSFWGPTGTVDLPYDGGTDTGWSEYVPAVLMLVRLVGIYSFMRGIVMSAKTGSGHAPPGTIGKVMVHIFGGILCVHIMGTIKLIESIFGFDFSI